MRKLMLTAVGALCFLQAQADAAPFPNMVETGISAASLSHNQGDWFTAFAIGEMQAGDDDRLRGEVLKAREFHDTGNYASVGDTHNFNDLWYGSLTAGGSSDGFFLPRYRLDGFINRKWLDARNLVTTLGLGVDHARDVHKDQSLFLGMTYYFSTPWIVQGGFRLNRSDPGSIYAPQGFVAVTQGEYKKHYVTLRLDYGREAYQIVGVGSTISDFNSRAASAAVKEWVGESWGLNVRAERYHNPVYDRTGFTIGLFKEF
jgi:YaiO family outer membrane protein